jgi:hypothetical protein
MTRDGFTYIVICREDRKDDGSPGDYTLSTRRVFATAEAAQMYLKGVCPSREPLVINGRFHQLRFYRGVDLSTPIDEWELVNPLDYPRDRYPLYPTLYAFRFGEGGTVRLLVWSSSVEKGLETAAEWLESKAPGVFVFPDYVTAAQELGHVPMEQVSEKAESGLTYTEAGWIPSHECTVIEAAPDSDLTRLTREECARLWAEEYPEG